MGNCKTLSSRSKQGKKKTPKGHIVVYVGEELGRYVVPISCLKEPQFQQLLEEAAQIYGFDGDRGITLPCSESTFLTVLNYKPKKH